MNRKEMEVILKNSYKGKEILKYINKLEKQISDIQEIKVEQQAKEALLDFERLFVSYWSFIGCTKEEEDDIIANILYIKYLIKDYFKLLEQINIYKYIREVEEDERKDY